MKQDDRSVGIRDLKSHTSEVLRRMSAGETITITVRNEAVAVLAPVRRRLAIDILPELVSAGRVAWSGGKPTGCKHPARVRVAPVADAVIEDRR